MKRTSWWQTIAVSAAVAGMSMAGVATADAAAAPRDPAGTASDARGTGAENPRTRGSAGQATRSKPSPAQRPYGPYISPDKVWLVAD